MCSAPSARHAPSAACPAAQGGGEGEGGTKAVVVVDEVWPEQMDAETIFRTSRSSINSALFVIGIYTVILIGVALISSIFEKVRNFFLAGKSLRCFPTLVAGCRPAIAAKSQRLGGSTGYL